MFVILFITNTNSQHRHLSSPILYVALTILNSGSYKIKQTTKTEDKVSTYFICAKKNYSVPTGYISSYFMIEKIDVCSCRGATTNI